MTGVVTSMFSDLPTGNEGEAASTLRMAIPLRTSVTRARWQLFPIELNRKVASLTPHRICGVNRASRVDEKARAGELAVLVGAVNLHYCLFAVIKNVFDLTTDGRSGSIFRPRR